VIGETLKNIFLEEVEIYPYRAYSIIKESRLKAGRRIPDYTSVFRYFFVLKEFDAIRRIRTEPGKAGFRRAIYTYNPAMIDLPIWYNPPKYYNPLVVLGRSRYRRLKREAEERGVHVVDLFFDQYHETVLEVVEVLRQVGRAADKREVKMLADVTVEKLKEYMKRFGRTIPRIAVRVPRILRMWEEGVSVGEIAERLGVSPEEALRRLVRAMSRVGMSSEEIAQEVGISVEDVERLLRAPPIRPPPPPPLPQVPAERLEEVVTLFEVYEMSPQEIAEQTGLPVDAVTVTLIKHLLDQGVPEHLIAERLGIKEEEVAEIRRRL